MLRFTIRELVLLTAVVAVGVAWWLDHARLLDARFAAIEAREAALEAREVDKWASELLKRLIGQDSRGTRLTVTKISPKGFDVWWDHGGGGSSTSYFFPDLPEPEPESGWPSFGR